MENLVLKCESFSSDEDVLVASFSDKMFSITCYESGEKAEICLGKEQSKRLIDKLSEFVSFYK